MSSPSGRLYPRGVHYERHRREREKAYIGRLNLIERLGGVCYFEGCGKTDELEIDHINGRDWMPRKESMAQRLCIYLREEKQNKLRVACRKHNAGYNPRKHARKKATNI